MTRHTQIAVIVNAAMALVMIVTLYAASRKVASELKNRPQQSTPR